MTYDIEQLLSYSSLFSSQSCMRALRFGDIKDVQYVFSKYDSNKYGLTSLSCWNYLDKIYNILKRYYRNEYVYKNELINNFIQDKYCQKDTVVVNEFATGTSIADIAMFNGCSKAFEIKSDRDSDKRLIRQLEDYQQLFEECYIVIPEEQLAKYKHIVDDRVGILLLGHSSRGDISIYDYRTAQKNSSINVDILMSSVRMPEYKWMVKQVHGCLPDVNCFQMFEACKTILSKVPEDQLHKLFNEAIKLRQNKILDLKSKSNSVRQLFLSLNASLKKENELYVLYQKLI